MTLIDFIDKDYENAIILLWRNSLLSDLDKMLSNYVNKIINDEEIQEKLKVFREELE